MSLQDELINIEVEIKSNTNNLAEDFKKTSETASELRGKITQLEKAMSYLKLAGKDNSEQFSKLQTQLNETKKSLKATEGKLTDFSKVNDISALSASQLRKRLSDIRKEMDSTSKSLNPAKWNDLNKTFQQTKNRLSEVSAGTKQTSASMEIIMRMIPTSLSHYVVGAVDLAMKAIAKIGKDLLSHTQLWADKWDHFTSGVKKSYESMLTTITTGDWSNFFTNLKQGYLEGSRLAAVLDELFELNNSLSILEVKNNTAIAEQQAIMRDQSKTSAQRIAAAKEIVRLEKEINKAKKETAEVELSAAKDALRLQTKMTDNQMEEFIDNYIGNRDTYKQAEEFIRQEEKLKKLRDDRDSAGRKKSTTQTEMNDLSNNIYEMEQQQKAIYESNKALASAVDAMNRYNLGNDELVKNYVEARKKMLQADAEFNQGTVKSKAFIGTESYKAEVDASERASREIINNLKEQYATGALTKEQYNIRMTEATQELYRKQMEIAVRYGKDTTELESKLYDAAIARRDEMSKESVDGYKSWLKEIQKELDRTMSELRKQEEAEAERLFESITTESGNELSSKLKTAMDINANYGDKDSKLQAAETKFDLEMQQLEELHDMQYISEEAYQEKKKELIEEYTKECIKIETEGWQKGFQAAQQYLNSASSLSSALQEAESASLDARMQKELTAVGNNADERAAIEERYEAQKLELQKKYANIDMGIQIAQAIANGALAITQCFASMPTPAAIPMAVILAATTAAQVATIIAQRNAIMNSSASGSSASATQRVVTGAGFSEGGYTGDGGRLEPAGIVHRGEYVVPMPEMRNPAVISRVREIEAIRTQRTSAHRMPGFAEGGYTDSGASGQDASQQLIQAIQALRTNPLKAYVVLSDLQAQQNLTNSLKQAGSR